MINYSNYVNEQIKFKELYPDLRLFAQENKIPIVEADTAVFLQMLVAIHRPKQILEIGAAIGYSALCLLKNFSGKKFVTIEISRDNLTTLQNNLAGYANVEIVQADALTVLPKMSLADFDLVFVDACKADYQKYFDLLDQKICRGTLLIFDNVFWHGAVVDQPLSDRYLKAKDAIKAFTKTVLAKRNYCSTLVNVGDGLLLSVKNG